MRVLISGSKNFGDTALLDIILDGLEDALLSDDKEVVVITGHRKGAEHCCQMITEARHSKCRIWSFGKNERYKRSQMISKGQPHMAFFLVTSSFHDGTSHSDDARIDKLRREAEHRGIPTYIIMECQ